MVFDGGYSVDFNCECFRVVDDSGRWIFLFRIDRKEVCAVHDFFVFFVCFYCFRAVVFVGIFVGVFKDGGKIYREFG